MNGRIRELDALRGIAALAVVLFHFTIMLGRTQSELGLNIGCMGVDMFFIISGFVIFMTIQRVEDWQSFVRGRFNRLYPTYWACVTIVAILMLLKNQSIHVSKESYELTNNLIIKYLANMTMFQYFIKIGDLDGSYWTLAIELVFYISILVLIVTKTVKYTESVGLSLLAFCFACSFTVVSDNYLVHKIIVLYPLVKYFPLFYAGILLYKMKTEGHQLKRMALFCTTFIVQCTLFTKFYHNNQAITIAEYVPTLMVIYALFLLYLFDKLSFVINPVTQWLGKISYSLYAIHQYVGASIIIPLLMKFTGFPFWLAAISALALVLILASLINQFIEKPALNYLKKKQVVS